MATIFLESFSTAGLYEQETVALRHPQKVISVQTAFLNTLTGASVEGGGLHLESLFTSLLSKLVHRERYQSVRNTSNVRRRQL